MKWQQMVKDLNLPNEQQFTDLLERSPADPLIYIIKVQDKVKVKCWDYYKILKQKYEEEGNEKLYKIVREYEYVMRNDRERKKEF
jgi:hypothetical protein